MKKSKPATPAGKRNAAKPPLISKSEIISLLEEMADILEILGENPFKVRSYATAARALESLPDDLAVQVASGELLNVKGIGKAMFSHIEELIETGRLGLYEDLRKKIPDGLLEMRRIPGMGPKKVKALYDKLGITTIDELEKAAEDDRVAGLDGFGARTQQKILSGIKSLRKYSERHLLSVARKEAELIYNELAGRPDVKRALLAGSLRRVRETVKDIDILVSAKETDRIMERFTSLPHVASVVARGTTKSSVVLTSGINADLRVVGDAEFPFAAHYFTGSKEHNTLMRARAKKMGYKLNEYGLFKGEKPVRCKDEEAIYKKLGLDYIPPELREGLGEIEAAEAHDLPHLVSDEDIKGLLHCHSTYSDGNASVEDMANGAGALGHKYLGIADHSQSAVYAGGLTPDRIEAQAKEIAELNNKKKDFRIFHGIESDILVDGSLDYPEEILACFDYVVASVHSNFNLAGHAMTRRIIRAIENKYTTIVGHPTGRLLLTREGYEVDLNAIIDAAGANNVIIEINSHPQRLDLDWRYVKIAKEKGVKIAICPDAHSIPGLEDYRYGIGVARKGWLTAGDVVNTLNAKQVEALFRAIRSR
jgi:DNA polymerase (family 10)